MDMRWVKSTIGSSIKYLDLNRRVPLNNTVEHSQAKVCNYHYCQASNWECENWNECGKYTPAT